MAATKAPTRTADDVIADVRENAERIATVESSREALYDQRVALFHEGRGLDPKVTQAALATAAGVSETAVITALRKPAKVDA